MLQVVIVPIISSFWSTLFARPINIVGILILEPLTNSNQRLGMWGTVVISSDACLVHWFMNILCRRRSVSFLLPFNRLLRIVCGALGVAINERSGLRVHLFSTRGDIHRRVVVGTLVLSPWLGVISLVVTLID